MLSVATNRSVRDSTPRPIPTRFETLYLFHSESECRGTCASRAPATTVDDTERVTRPS